MAQFSMEIMRLTGSVPRGNQHRYFGLVYPGLETDPGLSMIENHIDFLADELVELLEAINRPALGACLDTANNMRMLENPSDAIIKLTPYAKAVHLKDITAFKGCPRDFGFWPSVPIGQGLIDIPLVSNELRKAEYTGLLAIEIDHLHPAFGSEESAVAKSIAYVEDLLATNINSNAFLENA